jgi:hypothetical protein
MFQSGKQPAKLRGPIRRDGRRGNAIAKQGEDPAISRQFPAMLHDAERPGEKLAGRAAEMAGPVTVPF